MASLMTLLMQSFLSLLLISSYCNGGDSKNTYHVNSSSDLEQYLCNTIWSTQHLVLLLNSSINFTISSGNFCQVRHQISTVIIKSDSPTKSVTITCVHNDKVGVIPKPRRGFLFFTSKVMLERLVFKNCGTYLTTVQNATITDYLNSSSLYYTSSHSAVLVFVHCQVNITQVNIYSSYGFAMIGVNLYNSTIDNVSMSNSSLSAELFSHLKNSLGCGLLLHFTNTNNIFDIQIKNAFFSYNIDYNIHSCINDVFYKKYLSSVDYYYPIVNAAGLTILYTQQTHYRNQVTIHVTKSYFHENIGGFAGGMLVLQYNTFAYINTSIVDTVFYGNSNTHQCHGAALIFYWFSLYYKTLVQKTSSTLHISNTSFIYNQGFIQSADHMYSTQDNGAVYIGIVNRVMLQIHIDFISCKFHKNYVSYTGACLYASVYQYDNILGNVSITLDSTVAEKNSQNTKKPFVSSANIFHFHRINRVDIIGKSTFSNNYGSVISSQDSNVYLSGNLTFDNNHAMTGPAIRLVGNCQLYFMSGVIAKFIDNSAHLFGGAIYANAAERHDKWWYVCFAISNLCCH